MTAILFLAFSVSFLIVSIFAVRKLIVWRHQKDLENHEKALSRLKNAINRLSTFETVATFRGWPKSASPDIDNVFRYVVASYRPTRIEL